jgi:hypothetical protein
MKLDRAILVFGCLSCEYALTSVEAEAFHFMNIIADEQSFVVSWARYAHRIYGSSASPS